MLKAQQDYQKLFQFIYQLIIFIWFVSCSIYRLFSMAIYQFC